MRRDLISGKDRMWVCQRSRGDKAAALKELEDSIKMFDEQNVPSH